MYRTDWVRMRQSRIYYCPTFHWCITLGWTLICSKVVTSKTGLPRYTSHPNHVFFGIFRLHIAIGPTMAVTAAWATRIPTHHQFTCPACLKKYKQTINVCHFLLWTIFGPWKGIHLSLFTSWWNIWSRNFWTLENYFLSLSSKATVFSSKSKNT